MIKNFKAILFFSLLLFPLISAAKDSIDIVPEAELIKWGYKSKGTSQLTQSSWEKDTFGQATIYKQKIRSIKALKDWKGAHYRFNLIRENYSLEGLAENRQKNIMLHPPGTNTKAQPEYVLRSSFRAGTVVYLITTDVLRFESDMMPKIKSQFNQYVTNNQ